MGFRDRLAHAWNAFTDSNRPKSEEQISYGPSMGSFGLRPSRTRMSVTNERSLIASIYTRIAVDATSAIMKHTRTDDDGRYEETIKSGLNNCLTVEANLDQGASAFRQDIFMTLLDKGVIAVVPIDVDTNPLMTGGYDIKTMRVGRIIDWFPEHVRVEVYNQKIGRRQELVLPKRVVAIVENPFYSVMNEPNSTLQRLLRKLTLMDTIDEAAGSGKLDIIIQLPYTVRTETRRAEAEKRRTDIEMQLKGSTYGIAYADSTEKITQLNRPAENNILKHIEYLTELLYGQLGLTKGIFDGTADEAAMLNYDNRTIRPILDAVVEAFSRTFLTKTARSQGQTVMYLRDPFKYVPISQIAEIADKFTRNEIASSNEIRGAIGWTPSKDPKADMLVNSNMPQSAGGTGAAEGSDTSSSGDEQNALLEETLKSLESSADEILKSADG